MSETQLQPAQISPTPFPSEAETIMPTITNQGANATGSKAPGSSPDIPLPNPLIAQNVVSQSIDTVANRIKGSYKFDQMGAIQIGQYKNGVSGQIQISPNGIVATNANNETTFSLDGETGDAVFKGTVQAKDFTIIDDQGLVSLSAFAFGNIQNTSIVISSSTFVDVTGTTLEFTLGREVNVLILMTAQVQIINMVNSNEGDAQIVLNIDGSNTGNITLVFADVEMYTAALSSNYSRIVSLSGQQAIKLNVGTHTLKAQAEIVSSAGVELEIISIDITYIALGS